LGSNNKSLVWLDWHPTNRTWIAAAVVQDLVFDTRVEQSGRASVSHVVVYSFAEFSAQIVLEAPLDIFCFKWNPWQPNLIAAGCSSGQVLLYDLTDAMATIVKAKTKSTKSLHGGHGSGEPVRCVGKLCFVVV
jgi:dynein intermediate chain 3, axonemal